MEGVYSVEFEEIAHKFFRIIEFATLVCHDDEHGAVDQLFFECLTHSYFFPAALILLSCLQIHRDIPCLFLLFSPIVTMMN